MIINYYNISTAKSHRNHTKYFLFISDIILLHFFYFSNLQYEILGWWHCFLYHFTEAVLLNINPWLLKIILIIIRIIIVIYILNLSFKVGIYIIIS